MKIPLTYVKLRDTLDSTEPLNTTGLSALRGWKLTLDTDLQLIAGTLTRGEGEGQKVNRVMFHAAAAAHWVPESWDWWDEVVPVIEKWHIGADGEIDHHSIETPKPKPTGGKRGKTSRGTSNRPNAAQPQPAPGAEHEPGD